jgi:hypothetical protein
MKVKQLIKKLQKCKPNAHVYTAKLESGSASFNIIKTVVTEQVVYCVRRFKGRQVVSLINLDSYPLIKDWSKLKVVR